MEQTRFFLEKDDSLLKSIFKIRNSFNIHSAIQIVNSTNFNKFTKEVKKLFGWKIVLIFSENIGKIVDSSFGELVNDQHSSSDYDFLLTELNWQQVEFQKIISFDLNNHCYFQ